MATAWVECWKCEACGHRWIKGELYPSQCGKCRSRRWNAKGEISQADIPPTLPASPIQTTSRPAPASESPASLFARLGLTTASKMHELPPPTISTPVEDDEPALPECSYSEYDMDSGETMHCGKRQHTFKVKHGDWYRV